MPSFEAAKKLTILVVGGAGYIGSHINKMLRQEGYSTLVFDNLSRGNRLTIADTPFIQGDLSDSVLLSQIFENHPIGTVMHFAALTDVGESVRNPAVYYLNNASYTLNLLNALVKHGVKHFVYSSSAAIFGLPHSASVDESHPCNPINPYGESKWMVEMMLRNFDSAYGLKSCCIRYFNAAGGDPEGKIKYYQSHISNLIPLTLKSIKAGDGTIKINGIDYPTHDGTCIRDYIHIEDLGAAHLLCMRRLWETEVSSHYNLGIGQGYSVREVIHEIEKATGRKIDAIESNRRPGDPSILVADPAKAMRELNWKPRYPLLKTMIEHAWRALDS